MKHGHSKLVFLLLLSLGLLLVACEMPAPDTGNDDAEATAVVDETVTTDNDEPTPDPDVGGGTPAEAEATQEAESDAAEGNDAAVAAAPTATETSDTPRLTEEATATPKPDPTAVPEETVAEPTEEAAKTTSEEDADGDTDEADNSDKETETAETTDEKEETTTLPATHTVGVGENLYRIGLNYGISWVRLAEFNNLTNANQIVVGQVLNIPGSTPTNETDPVEPQPTPSPLTETTYRVQVGDNLYRIGLAYGISWDQIAEANGIVNPNQIVAGQEIKIPVDTPGPTPQFTHEVKAQETLFLISLQYGVTWTVIAEANNLASPYVIYEGQTLVIPGGG